MKEVLKASDILQICEDMIGVVKDHQEYSPNREYEDAINLAMFVDDRPIHLTVSLLPQK